MNDNPFKLARTEHNKNGKQSVAAVAEATGITKSLLDDLESSAAKKRGVSYLVIKRLAEYYGVPSDYLLGLSPCYENNASIKKICDHTGLSPDAVERLHAGLGLPTKRYRKAGYDLLDYLIVADHGIGVLIHSLVSANLGVERSMEKFEEIQKADQSQLERFEALDQLLKDIVIDKYQISEWFGTLYDLVTGYKDAKAAIEAAINQ